MSKEYTQEVPTSPVDATTSKKQLTHGELMTKFKDSKLVPSEEAVKAAVKAMDTILEREYPSTSASESDMASSLARLTAEAEQLAREDGIEDTSIKYATESRDKDTFDPEYDDQEDYVSQKMQKKSTLALASAVPNPSQRIRYDNTNIYNIDDRNVFTTAIMGARRDTLLDHLDNTKLRCTVVAKIIVNRGMLPVAEALSVLGDMYSTDIDGGFVCITTDNCLVTTGFENHDNYGTLVDAEANANRINVLVIGVTASTINNAKSLLSKCLDLIKDLITSVGYINIKWFYKADNDLRSCSIVEPATQDVLSCAYPFLPGGDVDAFVDGYLNSNNSIILLVGPPGTGKTRLIRYILSRRAKATSGCVNTYYTLDGAVLQEDRFFIDFMVKGRNSFLVLEDIDEYLRPRTKANEFMKKALNLADGIVKGSIGKIMLTTNLTTAEVDPALIRPGRCYKVVNFTRLTPCEALRVARELNPNCAELPTQADFSLAEIYSQIQ